MNRIKELRTGKGIYQAELAKHLKIAQNTLSYWEQGKFEPDHETLIKIADYFNCSVDCILGREEVERSKAKDDFWGLLSDREKEVIMAYRHNPSMREAVERLLCVSNEEQKTRTIYRAANSEQHTEHGIEQRDESAMKRLAAAPKVKKEEDL